MNDKEFTSLQDLRNRIDSVDRELVRLFVERMHTSAAVAEWKRENGKPVFDAARERALISRVSQLSGREFEEYTRVLYATIMGLSRAYQHKCLNDFSGTSDTIRDLLDRTPQIFPERAAVACQGVEGAYSQIAAERLFKAPEISFYTSFSDVFDAISSGACRYGVLPIENSTAGSVRQVYDLMVRHHFYIVRSTRIKIDHCLLVNPGTRREDIREVFSHEQAISQSAGFLRTLEEQNGSLKITPAANTAAAAKQLAESGRHDAAALSSRFCAGLYGLETLSEGVQDAGNNHTRFLCISGTPEIYPGADRAALMAVTGNRPGALYRILARFSELDVNLTKLESRPIPERDFESMFYFEIEVPAVSDKLPLLLSEMEAECEQFRFLGSYREVV